MDKSTFWTPVKICRTLRALSRRGELQRIIGTKNLNLSIYILYNSFPTQRAMDPSFNEKTPKKQLYNVNEVQTRKTPTSTPTKNQLARFLLLANNQSFTPSPNSLRQRVVRNPFEYQLHERLHLPMISSPSLFHTSVTPKRDLSSKPEEQFEWTIEDLSELNPVNVIPHETQFHEVLDPVREVIN